MRSFLRWTGFSLLFLGGCLSGVGCSDDEVIEDNPAREEYVPEGAADVANGALVHIVETDSIDQCALPLSALREVEITAGQNDYLTFSCEQRDGKWYIIPELAKALDKAFEIIPVTIAPREYPENGRTVLVVLRNSAAAPTKADAITSVYSEVIGKGTRCYGEFGNTLGSVFLYDQISKLGEEYVMANTTQAEFSMLELSGDSYEETMTNWSVNVGASFQKTIKPKVTTEIIGSQNFQVINITERRKPARRWNGSFDLGVSGSISSSEAYEYYLNLYRAKKAEVRMNMSVFDREKPDKALLATLSNSFKNAATAPSLDPVDFYDDWGTDVITQGSFGGYNIYIYGRKENVYEQSVGVDACASLRRTTPATAGSTWLEVYKNKSSDYAEGHVGVTYENDQYERASRAVSYQYSTGGNLAVNDPQKWLDGFNGNSTDNWALISYNVSSDEKNDSICRLFPIEELLLEMACVYDDLVTTKTEADIEALNRLVDNYNALVGAKEEYLNSKVVEQTPKSRLVLADIIVRSEANGHKKGTPKPFVGVDPNDQDNYLVYYPIMANDNAPCDRGYAFETSQDTYVWGVDNDDKYWYYALASSDDCQGIVDAVFCQDDTLDDIPNGRFYVARGVHANHEFAGWIDNNYLYVKYYDEGVDRDPAKKITAIGFLNKDDHNKIIASTGGSELRGNATQTDLSRFNEFWAEKNWDWYAGERKGAKWCYLEGTLPVDNQFYVVYTTQDLPIKRFTEGAVWQPKPW